MKHPFFTDAILAEMLVGAGQEAFFEGRMWERSTGKTTAAILKALLTATENPHKWVLVDSAGDYANTTRRQQLFNATAELTRPLQHTLVRLGSMRTTPPSMVYGKWPLHMLHEEFVWVKFGSSK